MTTDHKAIEFLCAMRPAGPWLLTAINPNIKGVLETKLFGPDTAAAAEHWIRDQTFKKWNIYWHVNVTRSDLTNKKAERTDILSVEFLHVDVDAGLGDLTVEKNRILSLFVDRLPKDIPQPTAVVASGGGYQAFWKLEAPIAINGDLARAEDAKLFNIELENRFGGDNCHNIDRVMRLPGTINFPDAGKRAKGRVEILADLLWHKPENVYPLSAFKQAHEHSQQQSDSNLNPSIKIEIGSNVRRITELEEMEEWKLPDRLKVIMVQGRHKDQDEIAKKKDNSRSSWLFDFCCNCVRAGVPDEVIYGIITDPAWGVSASVLELKGKAHTYALKQIVSAHEHAIDPWLQTLNERYAVIGNFGGKCMVMEFVEDLTRDDKREMVEFTTFGDLQRYFSNQLVQIGVDERGQPKYGEVGKWWTKHPKRRQYDRVVFSPGKDQPPNIYNLWQGFAYNPVEGNKHQIYLDHLLNNVCDGNTDHYQYLLNWMARIVQQPHKKTGVCVVLVSPEEGTGKGETAKHFGALFGRHYASFGKAEHFVGRFNMHQMELVLALADECFFAGNRAHVSIQKNLITEPTIPIEKKGVDVRDAVSYINLMISSNDEKVVHVSESDRRYFILKVAPHRLQNGDYFGKLNADMTAGGYENLLHMLMTRDIRDFKLLPVPRTDEFREHLELANDSVVLHVVENALGDMYGKFNINELVITMQRWLQKDGSLRDLRASLKSIGFHTKVMRDGDDPKRVWARVPFGITQAPVIRFDLDHNDALQAFYEDDWDDFRRSMLWYDREPGGRDPNERWDHRPFPDAWA